jgi:uncharacterized membrane protein YgcG
MSALHVCCAAFFCVRLTFTPTFVTHTHTHTHTHTRTHAHARLQVPDAFFAFGVEALTAAQANVVLGRCLPSWTTLPEELRGAPLKQVLITRTVFLAAGSSVTSAGATALEILSCRATPADSGECRNVGCCGHCFIKDAGEDAVCTVPGCGRTSSDVLAARNPNAKQRTEVESMQWMTDLKGDRVSFPASSSSTSGGGNGGSGNGNGVGGGSGAGSSNTISVQLTPTTARIAQIVKGLPSEQKGSTQTNLAPPCTHKLCHLRTHARTQKEMHTRSLRSLTHCARSLDVLAHSLRLLARCVH